MYSHSEVDSACCQGPLEVIRVKELLHCCGSARCVEKAFHVSHVGKELMGLLTVLDLVCLFEEHARGLLIHDSCCTFVSGLGRLLQPDIRDSRTKKEASTATSLAQLINTLVAHICSQGFQAS